MMNRELQQNLLQIVNQLQELNELERKRHELGAKSNTIGHKWIENAYKLAERRPNGSDDIVRTKRDLRDRIERNRQQVRSIRKNINNRANRINCNNCGGNHQMHRCLGFRKMTVKERRERVRQLKLCANCFMHIGCERDRHRCRFGPCQRCEKGEFHNSLLCFN